MDVSPVIRRLTSADVTLLRQLNAVFGDVFADEATYVRDPPTNAYLQGVLAKEHVIAVVAISGEDVVGGLVAYELEKFEKARRELYIYRQRRNSSHDRGATPRRAP